MTTAPRAVLRRLTYSAAVWMLAVSALAWWWMYAGGQSPAPSMPSMPSMPGMGSMPGMPGMGSMPGMGGGGTAGAGSVSAADAVMFLAMWAGMVIAMMLPVAVPLVAAHRFVTRTRGRAGTVATAVFIAGYLLVWMVSGLVPLLLMVAERAVVPSGAGVWRTAGTGLVIAAAGAFQFTGLKTRCLTVCRSPLSFVLTHDFTAGAAGTLRAGALNGLYCLGCCWALMLVQAAVGLSNLLWMGALTLLFLAERVLRTGRVIARAAGGVMVVLGVALMLEPLVHTPVAALVG